MLQPCSIYRGCCSRTRGVVKYVHMPTGPTPGLTFLLQKAYTFVAIKLGSLEISLGQHWTAGHHDFPLLSIFLN